MAEIPLTKGKIAIVDAADIEWLSQHKWFFGPGYAVRVKESKGKRATIFMHRQILGLKPGDGKFSDHINREKLDNRRANLRLCTFQENNQNKRPCSKSGFKGVSKSKGRNGRSRLVRPWMAQIQGCGKRKTLGYFKSKEEAARVYDAAARKRYGEFAYLNFPEEKDGSHSS